MSTEDDVRATSDKFYSGLDRMDVSALPEIWSHRDDVTTMHPMGGGAGRLGRGSRLVRRGPRG